MHAHSLTHSLTHSLCIRSSVFSVVVMGVMMDRWVQLQGLGL
jgi:hypothetical protein